MCAAVRRAAAKRAGAYPVSGDPGSCALPDGRQQAAWLPWTDQDEADYLARLALTLDRGDVGGARRGCIPEHSGPLLPSLVALTDDPGAM